jgi:hypothetical protein
MIRLLSDRPDIKQDTDYNTFFTNIKLLIIMSKAFLNSYPLEEQRLKEIIRTAEDVAKDCVDWKGQRTNFRSISDSKKTIQLDHIFFERARLLATMSKSFAQGNPVGDNRRMALNKNIDDLCSILQYVPAQNHQDNRDTKTA